LLRGREVAKDGHQFLEEFLVILEALMLSLGEDVENTDEALEVLRVVSVLREQVHV
jgi:hypothetical protein